MKNKIFYSLLFIGLIACLIMGTSNLLLVAGETAALIKGLNNEVVELKKDDAQKDQLIEGLLKRIKTYKEEQIIEDEKIVMAVESYDKIDGEFLENGRIVAAGSFNWDNFVYASSFIDALNGDYYLTPRGLNVLQDVQVKGRIDIRDPVCTEYSNSETGKGDLIVSVKCSGGTHIISGGFLDDSSGKVYLKASAKSGKNSWMCSTWSDTERTLTCYAYCCF